MSAPPPPPGYVLVTPAPEPTPPRRRSWLRWLLVGLAVAVVVAGAGVAALLVIDGEKEQDLYPDQWAAEVLPYVSIVEEERDLYFRNPVYVDFLSNKEFKKQVTADEEDLTDEDREEIEQGTGLLRAIGLLEGDVDLFEAQNKLSGSSVIGYYSFKDKRIRMRGEKLTPAAKSTLVHELTHALQDQHFDLGDHYESFEEDEGTAESVYRALVEGDARRIETAYEEDLSSKERERLRRSQQAEIDDAEKATKDVPKVLSTFMSSPYVTGEAMMQLALELDDNDAVNELFMDPPVNEEHLLDPWTLIEDNDTATQVAAPELADGEKEFDRGEFGATTWYLMLAERLPFIEALDAADGWGGDRYIAFDRGGKSCVRIAYVGETDRDRIQLERALRNWIAALPGSASVRKDGRTLIFESCDPGTRTDVGRDRSDEALGLAVSRTYLSVTLLKSIGGAPDEVARCLSDVFIHHFTLDQINDPKLATDPEFQAEVQRLALTCRP